MKKLPWPDKYPPTYGAYAETVRIGYRATCAAPGCKKVDDVVWPFEEQALTTARAMLTSCGGCSAVCHGEVLEVKVVEGKLKPPYPPF